MFKRILVAVDKTPVSRTAFQKAIALAKLLGAKLMIFHVLYEHETGSPDIPVTANLPYATEINDMMRENYQQQWQTFEAEYTDYLRWMADEARTEGIEAEFAQSLGDPGRSICNFAHEWQADLLIMGSHGRSGINELFLGSISNYVTHHASCSVLIVHQNDDSKRRNADDQELARI